ncbi:MAG: hypothetical protein KDC27_19185 [Acidobacteria bacterium]|nr:hypothetical protein [Acidobacteriota bacterium]
MTKPDEFLDVYMGKVYRSGHTEIVSMGVEWLFAQPFDLLADEDYFEFLIAVLHGEEL